MITVIHFSQDFQKSKSQLGGFSRILNICSDNNNHIIFTIANDVSVIQTWLIKPNIKVVALPTGTTSFKTKEQFKLYKPLAMQIVHWLKANQINANLLFGHSQIFNYFVLAVVKKKLKNIKLIWELNAIWGTDKPKGMLQHILNLLVIKFQKIIINNADLIIAQTNSSKEYVINNFNAQSNKIAVIENAILKEDIQFKTKQNLNKPYSFLCIGLFDKMNGIPFLLNAIKQLPHAINLHFFGNGDFLNEIQILATGKKVTYHGAVSRSEILQKLNEFTFIIIPRLPTTEAQLFIPTKLIECMANGVIPICSDVCGITEVVSDGVNGFIFKAGNTQSFIKRIYEINELPEVELLKIQKHAMQTIKAKYVWEQKHVMLNNIYNSLLSTHD